MTQTGQRDILPHPMPCSELTALLPLLPVGSRGRTGRAKAREVVGQDKDSLITEREASEKRQTSDTKAITHHLPQAD